MSFSEKQSHLPVRTGNTRALLEIAWAPSHGLCHQMYPLKTEWGAKGKKMWLREAFVVDNSKGKSCSAFPGATVAKVQRSHLLSRAGAAGTQLIRLFSGDSSSVPTWLTAGLNCSKTVAVALVLTSFYVPFMWPFYLPPWTLDIHWEICGIHAYAYSLGGKF